MDDKNNLKFIPHKLKAALGAQNIDTEGFICACYTDMDLDMRYRDVWFFLSDTHLHIAAMKSVKPIAIFGGFWSKKSKKLNSDINQDFEFDEIYSIDIKTLSEPCVDAFVSGGEFAVKIDGIPMRIAVFSNMQNEIIRKFCGILDKKIKNEELTDKDFSQRGKKHCPKCGLPYPEKERQICPNCIDRRTIFRRILGYFSPYKIHITVMMLVILLGAILNAALPYLGGRVLYDDIFSGQLSVAGRLGIDDRFVALGVYTLILVVLRFLSQAIGTVVGLITAKIVPKVIARLRGNIFDAMGQLSLKFFSSRQTGTLMTRVLEDSGRITSFFIDALPYIFVNGLNIIFAIYMMFRLEWRLAAMAVAILPFMLLLMIKWIPNWWRAFSKQHRASRSLNSQINDNLTGARVIKAFGQEKREIKRFHTYNSRVREAELHMVVVEEKLMSIFNGIENMLMLFAWIIGAFLIMDGNIGFGTLISFCAYVASLTGPLDFMSFVFRWGADSMNAAQRVFEIIDTQPDITEAHNPVVIDDVKGNIEVKNVVFKYEANKTVLKDVSFKAEPQKMLGIVGASGAGKSTMVNLISRLYDPDEGEITLDGVNTKDLSFETLRKSIALVSQETYIFMGTVAENISYANPDCPRLDIINAAHAAAAHDFIMKMEDGYDTLIGPFGKQLSGGERQRISIARAILANPKILILDEATASVDTQTEQKISASIDKLIKGRTTIAIAHRLSTLRNADNLIVVEDGKIIEEGTHEELYALDGTYKKLLDLQNKALMAKGLFNEE